MKTRPLSFTDAKRQFVNRFTVEHIPAWATKPQLHKMGENAGKWLYYAPQFTSDREWYENTKFCGESEMATADSCYTSGETWPHGQWLTTPFKGK